MNLSQDKKSHSHRSIHNFFETYGTQLAVAVPELTSAVAEFETLWAQIDQPIMDIMEGSVPTTLGKNQVKAEYLGMVWKLTSAMQYHFALSNNAIAANNVRMTWARLAKLPEKEFYSFAQMIINLHEPLVYVPYGIVDAEIDVLKPRLLEFPNLMQATDEARLKRKLAGQLLRDTQKAIGHLLKYRIDRLMNVLQPDFSREYDVYRIRRYIGLISDTRGNPHKHGTLAPGQIVVLDKHTYRRKRALIVTNTGASALLGGIGLTETELHGTPFTIEPGQTRRRITQKLAPEGEYFLLQNMGEEETGYEVWMKE